MNVLYIEDHAIQARLVRDMLSHCAPHIRLYHAATLTQALGRLRDSEAAPAPAYDLVLADIQLPDGSGLDILRHVRQQGLPLAVVMLSGSEEGDHAMAALSAGADAYLIKQGDFLATLPQVLQTAVDDRRNAAGPASPDPT